MVKIDVHKMFLSDAIEEILIKFDECVELGDYSLGIVHGHKHGTVIRDYIRSNSFLKDVIRNGHEIAGTSFSDKGVTIFQLTPSKKSLKTSLIQNSTSTGSVTSNQIQTDFCYKCIKVMILLKDVNWYKCPKCGKFKKR